MSALIRTSILLVFVALSSASCSDTPPAGFELAYKEMQRLNLCIDLKTKRELVGPSFAFPSTFGGADPGDLEVWVSRVGRVDEAGRPDYIRPEMANKMGAYPFTFRTFKEEFKAAFLVVAKIGQNENAEMLHNAIEKGIPLGVCRF
jgi:hypothetical protein